MTQYNVICILSRTFEGEGFSDFVDEVYAGKLAQFHTIISTNQQETTELVFTLEAEDLDQATGNALELLSTYADKIGFEVLTTEEFDRRWCDQQSLPTPTKP